MKNRAAENKIMPKVIPGQVIAAISRTPPRTADQAETTDKFWNFTPRNAETNAPAELILYGDIASHKSWWDDEITPKQFDADLKALGDVDEIIVRINSGGGDVFAANAIYTRLKDHKANIIVKIDGWAASAATIIAMAGDKILIPANGVLMIHNPQMGVLGYYSAKDFIKLSEELAVIKQSIVKGYCLKTGKPESEISDLMDKETWLDGEEAVESGFCTEIMFEDIQTEVEDESHIVVNSIALDLANYKNPPKSLFNCRNSGDFTNTAVLKKQHKGGNEEMEIKTVDDLKAAYPELTAQIESNAVAGERKRIRDIESLSLEGYEKIANAAKFDNPISSGDFAVQIIAAQKKQRENYAANVEADVQDSGIKNVTVENREAVNGSAGDEENPYTKAIDKILPQRKEN